MRALALASASGSGHRGPTVEDRLIARMLGRSIDRELATGVVARITRAHAARVEQLTAPRTRAALASSLERLLECGEGPVSRFGIAAVPRREQVREATGVIRATANRLRSAEPLDARGIARLKTLLSDRTGPCYVPSHPDALKVAMRDIAKSLNVVG
jgi:hypothetical protein